MTTSCIDSKRRIWLIAASVASGAGSIGRIGALAATAAITARAPLARSQPPSGNAQALDAPGIPNPPGAPNASNTPDASVEIDIGGFEPGSMMTVAWRGQPVWILNRTDPMLAAVRRAQRELADPDSKNPYSMPLPAYCRNDYRARVERPHIFVALAVCTHLSCTPVPRFQAGPQPGLPDDWPGGFLCPCHGSTYDLAGRVFKNVPATQNLDVPRYMFTSPTRIVIGRDEKGAA